MSILTHKDLINLINEMYNSNDLPYMSFNKSEVEKGLCLGINAMWIKAKFLGPKEEARFYARLQLIADYKADFKELTAKINQSKLEIKTLSNKKTETIQSIKDTSSIESMQIMELQRKLHADELNNAQIKYFPILEISAFIEELMVSFIPNLALFDGTRKSQIDLEAAFNIITSKENQQPIKILATNYLILTSEELLNYFSELANKFDNERINDSSIVLHLTSDNHSIACEYLVNNVWQYMDSNYMGQFAGNNYVATLNTKQLIEVIFMSFEDTKYTLMRVDSIGLQNGCKLLAEFNACNLIHQNKQDMVLRANNRGNDLLYLGVGCNDLELVDCLIKQGVDYNKRYIGDNQGSAIYLAADNNCADIFHLLLKQPKIDINSDPLLAKCCVRQQVNMVRELVQKKDVVIDGVDGDQLPLTFACFIKDDLCRQEIITILLENGANFIIKKLDISVVELLFGKADLLGIEAVLRYLIKSSIDLNTIVPNYMQDCLKPSIIAIKKELTVSMLLSELKSSNITELRTQEILAILRHQASESKIIKELEPENLNPPLKIQQDSFITSPVSFYGATSLSNKSDDKKQVLISEKSVTSKA